MKIRNIETASLIIAAGATVVAVIAYFTAWAVVVAAVGGYFLSHSLIRRYVIFKIKPIYQILKAKDTSSRQISGEYPDKDIVTEIKSDLETWAEQNSDEIARLRENEKYRKEFVGNVSHELKTPIFSIQGYVLTLLDGGLEDPDINRKYLEHTEKNIDRLINIINDLEDISRLESGELTLHKERFDIVSLTAELAESLEFQCSQQETSIVLDHNPEVRIWVSADKKRIGQVVINLLTNAVKYGRKNGLVKVRFIDVFDKILIEVQDNGIGIEQSQLSRIFERFYRVDKSRSRDEGGTGLGLSIVKHIIEAHNETITVRSNVGVGTTFSFTLDKA